jgi:uncharacterized protein (TIGR02145 family)
MILKIHMHGRYGLAGAILLMAASLFSDSRVEQQGLKDFEGTVYKTVCIGDQVWMAENLRATCDPQGRPLTSYCPDDTEVGCEEYGRLYTWESALRACPKGWHLPTREECERLIASLGGSDAAAAALKPGGASGFEACYAGGRSYKGVYNSSGSYGAFWCNTAQGPERAWHFGVSPDRSDVDWFAGHKMGAVSVRYVKDGPVPR